MCSGSRLRNRSLQKPHTNVSVVFGSASPTAKMVCMRSRFLVGIHIQILGCVEKILVV